MNEADTCRVLVLPKIEAAGWDSVIQIQEQFPITDGRIHIQGRNFRRSAPKKPDYILSIHTNQPTAIVEAKREDLNASEGLQQAVNYAEMLGLRWAYSTNGHVIIERDLKTGTQREIDNFPTPDQLWDTMCREENWNQTQIDTIEQPYHIDQQRTPRYYQIKAINRAIEVISGGADKALICLATGTGKSFIASQICYRLWKSRWNRKSEPHRKSRILYLADRVVLIQQPKDTVFFPFGDALHVIKSEAIMSREMYFATYQSIAEDELRPGLYREYDPEFFDLIIVDECHRGSSSPGSNWRKILDHFTGAAKLGMTATPLRDDNRDTYDYFGAPIIQYSLKQGIDDGFLAPYKVRRIISDVDSMGWRPERGQTDTLGRIVPDELYVTKDFERSVVLPQRTKAIAEYIVNYMHSTNPMAKTIIFCVNQPHALMLRDEIAKLVPEYLKENSDYICRITSDEGDIGRGLLSKFQDIDTATPTIVTTSELLTTGVDAPTVENIVLCKTINSISTFKQIIGRGTRVREDYNKLFFNILDFTGTATQNFADPEFDGYPDVEEEDTLEGDLIISDKGISGVAGRKVTSKRRFVIDDVNVQIIGEMEQELSEDGARLKTTRITEFAGEQVKTLYRDVHEFRDDWKEENLRREIVLKLAERGLELEYLMEFAPSEEVDVFDLLCHFAYGSPLLTRVERAAAVKRGDFWLRHQSSAREVLSAILDQYVDHGYAELRMPDILEVPSIRRFGNPSEISQLFGGASELKSIWDQLQNELFMLEVK